MAIPQYSKVRVRTSRFQDDGVLPGTVGWVIEIHQAVAGPMYEVEVMDDEGHTTALVVASEAELELVADE